MHGKRQMNRENFQSLLSYTSHRRLPPPHPIMQPVVLLAIPPAPSLRLSVLRTPGSAAKEGEACISTHHVALLKNWSLASDSGAGTPTEKEISSPLYPKVCIFGASQTSLGTTVVLN